LFHARLEEENRGRELGRRIHEVTDAYSGNFVEQNEHKLAKERAKIAVNAGAAGRKTIRRDLPKVGRNDTCPCGSGKKYKNCCGRK